MDTDEVVVLLCQAVLLAWTLCFLLVTGGNTFRKWVKHLRMSRTFPGLQNVWQWCFCGSPDDDRIAMRLAERRQQRMRIVAMTMKIAQCFNGLAVIVNIVSGRPRWYSTWMDIASIAAQVITIVFNVWPVLVSRMPNVLYSTAMAWLALHVSPAVESVDPFFDNQLFVVRFSLSLAILDMRTIIFWNVVNGVTSWCRFVFVLQDQQCAALQVGAFMVAIKEIIACVLIIAICYSYNQGVVAEIREKLGASASRRECGAVSALLKAMSDVVVKLDSNLRVLGECPTLAAMLLRDSVRNTEFEGYLFADEDRQLLHDCIASTAEAEDPSIVPWRIRLRDAMGTFVLVEFFHSQLEDVAGSIFHMVGIRELEDTEARAESEAEAEVLPPLQSRRMGANASTDAESGDRQRDSEGEGRRELPRDDEQPRGGSLADDGEQRGNEGQGPRKLPRDDEQPRGGSRADHGEPQPGGEAGQRGSNHQAQGEDVETASIASSSIASAGSNTSRKKYEMMIPGLKRTSARSQRSSMLHMMASWNFPRRSLGCCSFHACITEARITIKNIAGMGCNDFHLQCHKYQCRGCGFLACTPEDAGINPFTRTCNMCSQGPTTLGKVGL